MTSPLAIPGILSLLLITSPCVASGAALPPAMVHAAAFSAPPAPQASLRSYRVARIEVAGARRLKPAQVIAMSGLRVGQTVTTSTVDAASERLRRSGIFSSVGHRYRQAGYALVVVFEVTEPDWTMPVRYDNFLEEKEQELHAAIAASLPGFDGHLPETPQALARAVAAVEGVVRKRLPEARVSTMTIEADGNVPRHYRLRLEGNGTAASVCAVEFAGVPEPVGAEVRSTFRTLVGQDYSAGFLQRFGTANLLPAVRRRGFLAARVSEVTARRVEPGAGACPSGSVVATVTMEAGPPYRWGALTWKGVHAIAEEELARLVPLEAGATADGEALDKGLEAARAALGRKAYILARVEATPRLDPSSGVASVEVSVTEGARFRMRGLEIVGLEEELAGRVRAAWALKPGDYYDALYWSAFASEIRAAERQALAGRTTITRRERIDGPALAVDVVLEFGR